jgi:arginine/serine-rich splicing factor 4/5/6
VCAFLPVIPGFGFVEYKDRRDAEDALRDLQGRDILGSKIVVEWAKGGRNTGMHFF